MELGLTLALPSPPFGLLAMRSIPEDPQLGLAFHRREPFAVGTVADDHEEVRKGEAPPAPEERRSSRAHFADAVVLDGDYDPAFANQAGVSLRIKF